MLEKYELYYCEGLFLDEEQIKQLNIKKTNNIGLITLIQQCNSILEIVDNNFLNVDKKKIQEKYLNYNQEICYIVSDDKVILPPIKIYYAIKHCNRIIAFWDNENIRDAKLVDVRSSGIQTLIEDMNSSQEVINEYQKQMKLRKVYDNLNCLNKK